MNTVCFSKYYEDRLKNFTSPIISDLELVEIPYAVGMRIDRQTPGPPYLRIRYPQFQLSAIYRGLKKIRKIKEINGS